MRNARQYAVEVLQRHSHGRYGKEFYFGLYLPAYNKEDAKQVALETLAAMTFNEINSRCVHSGQKPWQIWHEHQHGSDVPIGFDLAERFFSFVAYIE